MTCSTMVRLSGAAAAKICRDMGFVVHTGRGTDNLFVQWSGNPFNPSSDIHRIPRDLVALVTIRALTPKKIEKGGYKIEGNAQMRVFEHLETRYVPQGFFTRETKVASETHQNVDISAPSLERALHIFQQAIAGSIKPDPVYGDELMAMLD